MIVLLTGDNDYRMRQSLHRMLREATETQGPEAIQRVDGSTVSPDHLPQLLMGSSLFAAEQTVVMAEPSKSKAVWERLGELLPAINESTTLIVVDSKPDKRTKTFKAFQQHGEVRAHGELSDNDLLQWLQTSARELGFELDLSLARYLVQHSGTDQWRLHHDLEKLAALGQPVTVELIRDIIEPEPRASAFDVLDAALAGDQARANAELGLLVASEDPYRFFGLLASQVYAITVCASAGNRPADQVAKDAGIHPFVVKKTMAVARRYSSADVRRLVASVAECDFKMKTTGTDPWVLMKLTIGSIAART